MPTTRRQFLSRTVYAGAGLWVFKGTVFGESVFAPAGRPARPRRISPNEKMGIACIGGGGQGYWDILAVGKRDDVVAIADVDSAMAYKAFQAFPKARQYKDFRKMLEEMDRQIDAVTVSIPDHQHAVAAMTAVRMGKHVYVQKPLAHDIWEVRQLVEAARQYGVVTQMGNHGTANNRFREAVEVVWSGAIGQVREVHVWSDRPFWPTGVRRPDIEGGQAAFVQSTQRAAARQKVPDPVPPTLDWDLWLGTAPERPYSRAYHPVKWRAWYDFGTGTLGDMGCHGLNLPFMALKLGAPTSITPEFSDDINEDTYPTWSIVRYEFPARGDLPPVKVTWYDGGTRMPMKTKETIAGLVHGVYGEPASHGSAFGETRRGEVYPRGDPADKPPRSWENPEPPDDPVVPPNGALLIGDKGALFTPDEYGWSYRLLRGDPPQSPLGKGGRRKSGFEEYKPPAPTLPRVTGEHHAEWVKACKGDGKTLSNFDYAGPLTEMVLLGSLAIRVRERIDWDAVNMKVTNLPKANDCLRRDYRKGWAL
jgi:hypothetical protein